MVVLSPRPIVPALLLTLVCVAAPAPARAGGDPFPKPTNPRELALHTLWQCGQHPAEGNFYFSPAPQQRDHDVAYKGGVLVITPYPHRKLDQDHVFIAAPAYKDGWVEGTYVHDRKTDTWTFKVTFKGEYFRRNEELQKALVTFLYRHEDLETVLGDERGQREAFVAYLKKEKIDHLVEFLDDYADLLKQPTVKGWDGLWSRYLGKDAKKPIAVVFRGHLDSAYDNVKKGKRAPGDGWGLDALRGVFNNHVRIPLEYALARWVGPNEVAALEGRVKVEGYDASTP